MASLSFLYLLASLFLLSVDHVVLASLLLEDGYAVTTVINGDEHQINPYSILPLFESSDLIVLDSSRSTFYTISLASSSQGGAVKKLAGNGVAGYADGELGSAKFNKPKSFAVDFKGNVYVADRFKHTIRKISKSGVSTIAGGYSQTTGKIDGPAQNASFSDDFSLAFIPERCAILISDHGNRLVRQIKLKAEDCTHGSQSGVGMTSFWILGLGLGLSCVFGMVVGFVFRPYVTSRVSVTYNFETYTITKTESRTHCWTGICRQGGLRSLTCNTTWNRCLMSLEKRVWMLCFVIRNVVVSSTPFKLLKRLIILSLSTIPLMFQVRRVEPKASCNKLPFLLDSDNSDVTYFKNTTRPLLDTDYYPESCEMTQLPLDSLKDLMIFDDVVDSRDVANTTNVEVEDLGKETTHVLAGGDEKIECLIRANMFGFMEKQTKTTFLDESLAACCNGQAKLKAI